MRNNHTCFMVSLCIFHSMFTYWDADMRIKYDNIHPFPCKKHDTGKLSIKGRHFLTLSVLTSFMLQWLTISNCGIAGENYPEGSHWIISSSEKLYIQFLWFKEDHDKKEEWWGQKRKTATQIRKFLHWFGLAEENISQFQSSNHNCLEDGKKVL